MISLKTKNNDYIIAFYMDISFKKQPEGKIFLPDIGSLKGYYLKNQQFTRILIERPASLWGRALILFSWMKRFIYPGRVSM